MKLADLLPREEKFYHMLESLAAKANASARLLNTIVTSQNPDEILEAGRGISQAKAEAKKIAESITAEVCRTFITPFDREDIQAFATDLYKILKVIDKAKERMITHQLRPAHEDFTRQVAIILRESDALAAVVKELSNGRNSKTIYEKAAILHELEDQGDVLLGRLISDVFSKTEDVRELILRKDIYEMLEHVIDYYRDAANVALQIILKHS